MNRVNEIAWLWGLTVFGFFVFVMLLLLWSKVSDMEKVIHERITDLSNAFSKDSGTLAAVNKNMDMMFQGLLERETQLAKLEKKLNRKSS